MQEYARLEPEAVTLIGKLLADAGTSMDALVVHALVELLDDVERIDRLTAIAESRRNACLREIDRRRPVAGETLRRSVQDVEDGEFEVIGTTPSKGKKCRVTSERKIRANRENARASTGPKTAPGRARAARNALRDALSLPVCSDPVLSEEMELLVREIVGTNANAEIRELAYRIAEAQVDLRRVRCARYLPLQCIERTLL